MCFECMFCHLISIDRRWDSCCFSAPQAKAFLPCMNFGEIFPSEKAHQKSHSFVDNWIMVMMWDLGLHQAFTKMDLDEGVYPWRHVRISYFSVADNINFLESYYFSFSLIKGTPDFPGFIQICRVFLGTNFDGKWWKSRNLSALLALLFSCCVSCCIYPKTLKRRREIQIQFRSDIPVFIWDPSSHFSALGSTNHEMANVYGVTIRLLISNERFCSRKGNGFCYLYAKLLYSSQSRVVVV